MLFGQENSLGEEISEIVCFIFCRRFVISSLWARTSSSDSNRRGCFSLLLSYSPKDETPAGAMLCGFRRCSRSICNHCVWQVLAQYASPALGIAANFRWCFGTAVVELNGVEFCAHTEHSRIRIFWRRDGAKSFRAFVHRLNVVAQAVVCAVYDFNRRSACVSRRFADACRRDYSIDICRQASRRRISPRADGCRNCRSLLVGVALFGIYGRSK